MYLFTISLHKDPFTLNQTLKQFTKVLIYKEKCQKRQKLSKMTWKTTPLFILQVYTKVNFNIVLCLSYFAIT